LGESFPIKPLDVKDPDAFLQKMRKEVRRRLVDAERVAWKRETMLARLRARDRSQPPPPAAYFLASVDDEDLVAPEVPLLWDATAGIDGESSPSPPSAATGEPQANPTAAGGTAPPTSDWRSSPTAEDDEAAEVRGLSRIVVSPRIRWK